ncbi:uncharacterized protein KY384_003091 [Bacidia gigantensis]|uniref:uncharacterized protein n=1 Tax=Bacidia gigantensis TaxID=2732470 RepID=UPI001D03DA91|nr:uncharacterized protein KY384_003091 [Bacidia gigantensis]KAG8531462.1 hypothetical protein KY384_003091 [Bacidia gigantensis]
MARIAGSVLAVPPHGEYHSADALFDRPHFISEVHRQIATRPQPEKPRNGVLLTSLTHGNPFPIGHPGPSGPPLMMEPTQLPRAYPPAQNNAGLAFDHFGPQLLPGPFTPPPPYAPLDPGTAGAQHPSYNAGPPFGFQGAQHAPMPAPLLHHPGMVFPRTTWTSQAGIRVPSDLAPANHSSHMGLGGTQSAPIDLTGSPPVSPKPNKEQQQKRRSLTDQGYASTDPILISSPQQLSVDDHAADPDEVVPGLKALLIAENRHLDMEKERRKEEERMAREQREGAGEPDSGQVRKERTEDGGEERAAKRVCL